MSNDSQEPFVPDEEFWKDYWNSEMGQQCVLQEPHECLVKFHDKLLRGRNGLKIFVPACGKTYDMIWLKEKGHQIVGVEISEAAVKHFFELNKLEVTETPVDSIDGKLMESKCGKIKIYVGDFFKFGPHLEKDFDAVWDAGALRSFPLSRRQPYVDVLKRVISPDCPIMLDCAKPCCSDPMDKEQLQTLFGREFQVEDLGFIKTEKEIYKSWGTEGYFTFYVHK